MQKSSIYKYILICFFSLLSFLPAQSTDTIRNKNQELQKIKQDISILEKELRTKTQKERESFQSLENIGRQNLLLNKLINNLLAEEKKQEIAINKIEQEVGNVERRIKELKEQYARYIVWFYKNRGLSMWRLILEAQSFNQAVNRYKYLEYISDHNTRTLKKLNKSRSELHLLRDKLENERTEKEILAKQKMKEQEILKQKEKEKKNLVAVLKKDQRSITEEISQKRRAEIFIKNLIAKLIESERERKIKLHENKAALKKYPQTFDYNLLENFSQMKGALGWPVREGKIIRKFGENVNERLNTVTLNYGIDIAVRGGQNVLAIAEGIVSAIDWIPGYGSVIIITHRDEFRTVYGHVSNILVKEGEKLKAGSVIGKVNESLEGNILHFEIWNERNYQNPELWLAKK